MVLLLAGVREDAVISVSVVVLCRPGPVEDSPLWIPDPVVDPVPALALLAWLLAWLLGLRCRCLLLLLLVTLLPLLLLWVL
jgi:hypothetical protein